MTSTSPHVVAATTDDPAVPDAGSFSHGRAAKASTSEIGTGIYARQLQHLMPDVQAALGPFPWQAESINAWQARRVDGQTQTRVIKAALAGAIARDCGLVSSDELDAGVTIALIGWQLGLTMTGSPRRGSSTTNDERIHACLFAIRVLSESPRLQAPEILDDLAQHLHWLSRLRANRIDDHLQKWCTIAEGGWLLRDTSLIQRAALQIDQLLAHSESLPNRTLVEQSQRFDLLALTTERCSWSNFDHVLEQWIEKLRFHVHPNGCVPSATGVRLPVSPVGIEILAKRNSNADSLARSIREYIRQSGVGVRWSTSDAANFALAAVHGQPFQASRASGPLADSGIPPTANGDHDTPAPTQIIVADKTYLEVDNGDRVSMHVTFLDSNETITCWRPALYHNQQLLTPLAETVRCERVTLHQEQLSNGDRDTSLNADSQQEDPSIAQLPQAGPDSRGPCLTRLVLVGRLGINRQSPLSGAPSKSPRQLPLLRMLRRLTGLGVFRGIPGMAWFRRKCRCQHRPRFRRVIDLYDDHVSVRDIFAMRSSEDIVYLPERQIAGSDGKTSSITHQVTAIPILDVVRSFGRSSCL
ncbi:MAG: hypothetical protein ACPGXK_08805 [Phycisphaerae bacterium]